MICVLIQWRKQYLNFFGFVFLYFKKILYVCMCVYVCICVCVCVCMPQCICGSQKTTCRNQFFPFTMWVQRSNLALRLGSTLSTQPLPTGFSCWSCGSNIAQVGLKSLHLRMTLNSWPSPLTLKCWHCRREPLYPARPFISLARQCGIHLGTWSQEGSL